MNHRTIAPTHTKPLFGDSISSQYELRRYESFGTSVSVLDYGQFAGKTSAACFWLCLAAGLAAINADVLGQALPAEHTARTLLQQLRDEGVDPPVASATARATRDSVLGKLAESLRRHFCLGSTAVLMRADVKNRIYQAFALLGRHRARRTEELYAHWVQKLASTEFADELVVLAVAVELSIRIVIIPYTPEDALAPWAIPTYGSTGAAPDAGRTIYLGNNDIHYVYLKPNT